MTESGIIRGKWWRSGTESIAHGDLDLDTEFQLHTFDCLSPVTPEWGVAYAPQFERLDAVHGRSYDGLEVTLLDVSGLSLRFGDAYTSVHESWRPRAVVLGNLVGAHESVSAVRMDLSGLMEWAQPRPVVDPTAPLEDSVVVDRGTYRMLEVDLGGSHLSLVASVEGSAGVRRADVSRTVHFEVEFDAPLGWDDVLGQWVWPLRQMLSCLLVQKVVASKVRVRVEDEFPGRAWPEIRFSSGEEVEDLKRYFFEEEVLFTLPGSPVSFADFLTAWFHRWKELRTVALPLVSVEDATFLYAEHIYMLRLAAAESAQKLLGTSGQELSPEAHNERVQAIITAAESAGVSEEDMNWAAGVLRSRNDKPLRARLQELVDATGEIGAQIVQGRPTFVRDAVKFRTPIAHASTNRGEQDHVMRWRLGEALAWMARSVLLTEAGVPREQAQACVLRHQSFRFLVDHLADDASGDG